MQRKALISVIVPVYNVEAYLPKCIWSIRRQTYQNLQIILVDDGSTDNSSEICDREALQDDRIEVIHQRNKGLVAARKAGLKAAKGEYIGFVDGDDYIDKEMYEELLNDLTDSKAEFIHSGFYENNEKVSIINDYEEGLFDISQNKMSVICNNVLGTPSYSERIITPSIWSKLFKAELLRRAYANVPDYQQFGEDIICLCACILETDAVMLTKNAYYQYVVREDSMSHIKEKRNISKYAGLYAALCELFQKYGKYDAIEKKLDIYLRNFLSSYVSAFYKGQVCIQKYKFPDIRILRGKRIIIYGAGKVGQDYYYQISRYRYCKIAGWVDKNFSQYSFKCMQVGSPDSLINMDYDVIVIAVKKESAVEEIQTLLLENGIQKERLLWYAPNKWCVPISRIEPLE